MNDARPNHGPDNGDVGVNKTQLFLERVRGLLDWMRKGFAGNINSDGEGEVKMAFCPRKGFEDDPEVMIRIIRFFASKIDEIDEDGQLSNMLNGLDSSVCILPPDDKLPFSELFRRILTGKSSDASKIARLEQVYVLALYLYMHCTGDSEEEMEETFVQLIEKYDDPKESHYNHGVYGLKAAPALANLCAIALEKLDVTESVRERFRTVLDDSVEDVGGPVDAKNVHLVFELIKKIRAERSK